MKKLIIVMFLLLLVPMVMAGTVTRSFSSDTIAPGGTVDVTLAVKLGQGDSWYAIEEKYPSGWTVASDDGTGDTTTSGQITWAVITGAKDINYKYTLKAPASGSEGVFSIKYSFSDAVEKTDAGPSKVTLSAGGGKTCPAIAPGTYPDCKCTNGGTFDSKTDTCSTPKCAKGMTGTPPNCVACAAADCAKDECKNEAICAGSSLKDDGATCASGTECKSGLCPAGICTSSKTVCTAAADCAAGEICTAGFCEKSDVGKTACPTGTECAAGYTCTAGFCESDQGVTCPTGITCPKGYACTVATQTVCASGYCNPSTLECDDKPAGATCAAGDGCKTGCTPVDTDCSQVPVCGDGKVEAPETCDDGNVAPGDGCSATCTTESTGGLTVTVSDAATKTVLEGIRDALQSKDKTITKLIKIVSILRNHFGDPTTDSSSNLNEAGAVCADPSECKSNGCYENKCLANCNTDADCTTGICIGDTDGKWCVPGACNSDKDCAAGNTCKQGDTLDFKTCVAA